LRFFTTCFPVRGSTVVVVPHPFPVFLLHVAGAEVVDFATVGAGLALGMVELGLAMTGVGRFSLRGDTMRIVRGAILGMRK
jgi:hypothetical protein